MNRILFVCLSFASLLSGQTIAVPPGYQDLYNSLTTQISAFDTTVKASWNGKRSPVAYAPHLLSADSTGYTSLLDSYHYSNSVIVEMTQLQALGAGALTVHIDFPILYQPFYVSNPSLYQQFVSFYQQLAVDVHKRGMKLVVESDIGIPFAGDSAGAYTAYLQGLSWNQYMAGRAQNALNVAKLIQADYMSVITEPDTEATYSFQPNAGTVSGSTQLLTTILSALNSAGPITVKIGAGAGTWIHSFPQYIQNFSAKSLDYIDVHVYPVNRSFLTNLLSAAVTIQAAGKSMAMSEAWDYKIRDNELGVLTITQIYARDPFSFWQPVDMAFLQAICDFANYQNLLFISPFWTHYFAAYLDYNTYGSLPDDTILNDSYTASANANAIGGFTATGLNWLARTLPAPDQTAPAAPAQPVAIYTLPNMIQLTWTEPPDNTGVAAYHLLRNGSLLTTTSLLTYTDLNLVPGETYTYSLTAFDASRNVSGRSSPIAIQTIDTTPPSVPANLHVTGLTSKSVALAWSRSTGIGGVGGYVVLRGLSPATLIPHASITTTTYTDVCSPATTYYYAVESFNPLHKISVPSAPIIATTPAQ